MTRTGDTKNRIYLRFSDAAAILCCVALFVFLGYFARYGIGTPDESFYFTIPQRLLAGDRLLTDEWQVSQFSSLLQLLPYALYTKLAGGTEGIILFFRYLFLGCEFILYWFFCRIFREKGLPAVAAAGIFMMNIPHTIITLNYYTMALQGAAVCCALLFSLKKNPSPPVFVFAGFVFGCVVLCQPLALLGWFCLIVLTLIRFAGNRRNRSIFTGYQAVLNFRSIALFTAGGALVAIAVTGYLLASSGVVNILKALPAVFSDANHRISSGGMFFRLWMRLRSAGEVYGTANLVFCAVCTAACFICRLFFREKKPIRASLFFLCCIAAGLTLLHALFYVFSTDNPMKLLPFHSVPLLFLGAAVYLISEKRDPGTVPFLFAGFLLTAAADLSSDMTLGFGGILTVFYTFPAFVQSVREIRHDFSSVTEKQNAIRKKIPRIAASVCFIGMITVFAVWEIGYCGSLTYPVMERSDRASLRLNGIKVSAGIDQPIEEGPMKGVLTTARYKKNYTAVLRELDGIRRDCPGRFCVAGLHPYAYLYAQLPCGAYSSYFEGENAMDRLREYWTLFPARKAAVIYLPREFYSIRSQYPTDSFNAAKAMFGGVAQKTSTGYILHVFS